MIPGKTCSVILYRSTSTRTCTRTQGNNKVLVLVLGTKSNTRTRTRTHRRRLLRARGARAPQYLGQGTRAIGESLQ